jgi:spore germination protein KC
MKTKVRLKHIIVFAILIPIIFFTACWNYVELDNRSLVAAVGLDQGDDDKIELSVQVIESGKLSKQGGSDEQAFAVYSAQGRTVFEAVREMTMTSDRKLFWQHNNLLIIGEGLAKKGVAQYTDFFIRDHESRARSWVVICEGTAKKMLKKQGVVEKIPAGEISSLIKSSEATSKSAKIDLHNLQVNFTDKNVSSLTSWLQLAKTSEEKDSPVFELTGAAVLKHDKFICRLDRFETRGVLWITDEINSGIIVVDSPDKEREPVGIEIISAKSKMRAQKVKDEFKIIVDISMIGNLGDQYGHGDLSTHEKLQSLENLVALEIIKETQMALDKIQTECVSDVFGFGGAIHRKDSKAWSKIEPEWEKILPLLDVVVTADVQINRSGLVGESIHDKAD